MLVIWINADFIICQLYNYYRNTEWPSFRANYAFVCQFTKQDFQEFLVNFSGQKSNF